MQHDTVDPKLRWGSSSGFRCSPRIVPAIEHEREITKVLTGVANVQLVKDKIAPIPNLWKKRQGYNRQFIFYIADKIVTFSAKC